MHDMPRVEPSSEELQALDNALDAVGADPHTRRWLVKRAGAGFVAAGAMGALGPVSSALGATRRSATGESPSTILNTAVTAELFAVLFLNQVIIRAPGTPSASSPLIDILRAAGASEYDHYVALSRLGAKPLATQIWIPDALYGGGGVALFQNIELAETLFVNAYLIAVTDFATAKQGISCRYASEILGVEAEHRVLARTAQGLLAGFTQPPDNVGFESYQYQNLSDIVAQLEGVGIGFGAQGGSPGQFYSFDGTKPGTFSDIIVDFPA